MSFRRTVVWLCAVLVGAVAGTVLVAAPAAAADYAVSLRAMPSSYRAGGSPGALSIAVTAKRKADCVRVLRTLAIRLDGLRADQVRVERSTAGSWRSMPVEATADGVRVADQHVDPTPLCKGRTSTGRYRVTFLSGVPSGRAIFVAQAFSGRGTLLGRDTATRDVIGSRAATPTPSRGPTPTPSAEPTAGPVGAEAAVAETPQGGVAGSESGLGIGAVVIGLGLLMVGIGAALLVLLSRRNRDDPEGGGDDRTLLPPTVRG